MGYFTRCKFTDYRQTPMLVMSAKDKKDIARKFEIWAEKGFVPSFCPPYLARYVSAHIIIVSANQYTKDQVERWHRVNLGDAVKLYTTMEKFTSSQLRITQGKENGRVDLHIGLAKFLSESGILETWRLKAAELTAERDRAELHRLLGIYGGDLNLLSEREAKCEISVLDTSREGCYTEQSVYMGVPQPWKFRWRIFAHRGEKAVIEGLGGNNHSIEEAELIRDSLTKAILLAKAVDV